MPIRYASTLILRRKHELFLARRAPELRFFGDFWAFPGGAVSDGDRRFAETLQESQLIQGGGESDAEAAGLPFRIALAREIFEELGLWFGGDSLGVSESTAARDTLRREVLADESVFYEKADSSALPSNLEKFRQVAHLLTPAYHPIRFDTYFFLLDHEEIGSEPEIWPGELVEGRFDTPENWLEKWRRREIRIAAPVLLLLQTVSRRGWDGAWDELAALSTTLGEGKIHTIFYNPAVQIFPVESKTRPPATHTNVLLAGQDPAYLVDPGCDEEQEQDRLIEGVTAALRPGLVAERKLRAILLTHHHPDHVAGAKRVADHFGIPVWAHAETANRVASLVAIDRLLKHGGSLPLGTSPDGQPGWELEVHFTPGHAAGHLAFFERRYETLIAGDLVSTLSSILIGENGDMIEYLASLEAMVALGPDLLVPSHGPAATRAVEVLQKQIEHRESREREVIGALESGVGSPIEMARQIYTKIPKEALPLAAVSVTSILRKLRAEGRASESDGRWALQ